MERYYEKYWRYRAYKIVLCSFLAKYDAFQYERNDPLDHNTNIAHRDHVGCMIDHSAYVTHWAKVIIKNGLFKYADHSLFYERFFGYTNPIAKVNDLC